MNAFDIDAVLSGIPGADYNPDTERYRTPLGIVTSLGPRHRRPKDGVMEWHQQGHVWRQGCLAWVRRWGWDGEWVLTGERTERIRQPPQRILPELTAEERQAWADVNLLNSKVGMQKSLNLLIPIKSTIFFL